MRADTPPAVSETPHRRRRRLWLALTLAALAGLLFGGLWLERWREDRNWREACAEADRLDPGWRWGDLLAARPAVPDEQNAVPVVRAAGQLLYRPPSEPEHWPDWSAVVRDEDLPPNDADTLTERRQAAAEALERDFAELTPQQRPRAALLRAVRSILTREAEARALTRGLENRPGAFLAIASEARWTGTVPRVLSNLGVSDAIWTAPAVARLLQLQTLVQADDGPADAAHDSARAILAVARAADVQPGSGARPCTEVRVIAVETLERILAQSEPSRGPLAAAQRAVEAELGRPVLLQQLRGSRALFEDFVRAADDGRLTRDQSDRFVGRAPPVTGHGALDQWLWRLRGGGWRKRYATAFLSYHTELIEIVKGSSDNWTEDAKRFAAARDRLPTTVQAWTGGFDSLLATDRHARALLRSVAAALAAERFRREHGRWPESLAELVPDYLKTLPRDPYDGQPLRYRRLKDGLIIYAVGEDGMDSGGQVRGTPNAPATDVGVRLWDPARRRQPPPALPPPAGTMP